MPPQGSADGFGSDARFSHPASVAADSAGNVYVADTANHTIRQISAAGVVSTLAGSAGLSGSADGTGSAARFNEPQGVAVDGAGNVYVADTGNHTIRMITPGGVVSTLAGLAGASGSANGTGSNARFYHPEGLAVDSGGNVYVADTWNHTIRKITRGRSGEHPGGFAGQLRQRGRHRQRRAVLPAAGRGGGQRGECLCGGYRQPDDSHRSLHRGWSARWRGWRGITAVRTGRAPTHGFTARRESRWTAWAMSMWRTTSTRRCER